MIIKSYSGQGHNFSPNLYQYEALVVYGLNDADVLTFGVFGCGGALAADGFDCLNIAEIGQVMRFDVGEDITGKTPALSFVSPIGLETLKTESNGVAVATDDYDDGTNVMLAGQHLVYVLEADFINMWGNWAWRAEASTATRTDKTDYSIIEVLR
jgi:hypothetical protein